MGRIVVVTGASSGIGEACARRLAERGFEVLAGVRRDEDGERIRGHHPGIDPVELDVTDEASIAALAERLGGESLAGLVNNAGITVSGPLEVVAVDDWRRQFDVNVIGLVAVTRALLPAIRRGPGRIVNVSSVGGRVALPLLSPYAASKFAVEGLSDSLRREVRHLGVHVAVVEPGAVATEIWRKGLERAEELTASISPEAEAAYGALIGPIRSEAEKAARRAIPPDDVAHAIEHALTAERPRTRYPVGRDAKMRIRIAGALPDRVFDALVARQLRS